MTTKCVAKDCKNPGAHLFPKDAKKRKLWEGALNRKNWRYGPYSRLCSAHFRPDDYSELSQYSGTQLMRKVLKRTAVPSVFLLTNHDEDANNKQTTNHKSLLSDEQQSDSETHRENSKPNAIPRLGTVTVESSSICNKHYASTQILNEHMKYVPSPNKCKTDFCHTCCQRFATESDLKAHLAKMRFPCKTCKKCFGSPKELSTHEFTHPTLAQYLCAVCGEQFEESLDLISHVRKHSTLKSYSRKKPKLTGAINDITDHSNYIRQNTITGSEMEYGNTNPKQSNCMGENTVQINVVTSLTGAVGKIIDHNNDTGQSKVTVDEETKITGAVKTKVKMEQDESETQKMWIEVDVKRDPDEICADGWLQEHVKTELNMCMEESQERTINVKEETVVVITEEKVFDILEIQVEREPDESGYERTV